MLKVKKQKMEWKIILKIILNNDFILIDGTFFTGDEIPDRNMSEIPHPFITESIELFSNLGRAHRSKVFFTHLNHTNPLLNFESEEYQNVVSKGYNVAAEGLELEL